MADQGPLIMEGRRTSETEIELVISEEFGGGRLLLRRAKREMIDIRDEQPGDVAAIRGVNRLAFARDEECRIVDALRANGAATLSLVAVDDDVVVGHIMFSPLFVGAVQGAGLGPMAVTPSHQRHGIGSRLVEAGIERLRSTGCPFIVVIGHPGFYPRFGFRPAASHGLTCEWEVPAEAFMVKVLNSEVGDRLQGLAQYRGEFATAE